jgi:two-component system, CitB family, response regulator DctR
MRTLRVLIVEDDPVVGDINREFTERVEGFTAIGVARSVAAAVEAVQRLNPDLVLLDVYMPDGDGVQLLREIRYQDADVDVIPVTAARNAAIVRQLMRNGAAGYILKPFKFERFAAVLQAYRRWRASVDGDSPLNQAEVDRLRRLLSASHQDELPKGLDQLTLKAITILMQRRKEFLTAEEVAEQVGASRVTARRYLEYLAESGQAEVKLTYGAVGRPVRRYQLVDLGAVSDGETEGTEGEDSSTQDL